MTDTPHPWNRRAAETAKAYAAFRFYCELGSRRSVYVRPRGKTTSKQHHSAKKTHG